MFYDAQIAGVPDSGADVRAMKAASTRELRHRRPRVVEAVSRLAPLELVNGGGTGGVDIVAGDPVRHRGRRRLGALRSHPLRRLPRLLPRLAFGYALPVSADLPRISAPCSAAAIWRRARSRRVGSRSPVWPEGLRVLPREGVGEVQTPVTGDCRRRAAVGDRVWWRHPKAGEVCERFASCISSMPGRRRTAGRHRPHLSR